jgi:hypothetical protein
MQKRQTCAFGIIACHHLVQNKSSIPDEFKSQVLQTIYALTGCDFISFFKGIGKNYFLSVFFQYSAFISSGAEQTPGTLADVNINENAKGFLAFVRLVGTAYF